MDLGLDRGSDHTSLTLPGPLVWCGSSETHKSYNHHKTAAEDNKECDPRGQSCGRPNI